MGRSHGILHLGQDLGGLLLQGCAACLFLHRLLGCRRDFRGGGKVELQFQFRGCCGLRSFRDPGLGRGCLFGRGLFGWGLFAAAFFAGAFLAAAFLAVAFFLGASAGWISSLMVGWEKGG
jgi:hypothetical protein